MGGLITHLPGYLFVCRYSITKVLIKEVHNGDTAPERKMNIYLDNGRLLANNGALLWVVRK